MRRCVMVVAATALALGTPAAADSRKAIASNGIEISFEGEDGFSPARTVAAPFIRTSDGGYVFAYRKPVNGDAPYYLIQGLVSYNGEWRFFDRAYYQGGVPARFDSLDRDVGHCSRYGGCSHSESYQVAISSVELAQHTRDGNLAVKIDAKGAEGFVIVIPKAYIDAVKEAGAGL